MSGHLRFGWECPLCSHFAAPTLKTVVRHIGAVHSHDPAFHVRCGVEDCPRTYRNYHTYKKHMYTKHRSLLNLSVTETAREEDISSQLVSNTSQSAEEIIMDDVTSFSEPNVSELEAGCSEHEASEHNSSHQMITDKRKASALFLLKAKEVNKISQSGLNAIIQDFTTLLDQKINSLKVEVSRVLRQRGAEEDICTEILSLFSESWLQNPFNGLDTEFLQQKFYTEAFGLVKPTERKLGHRIVVAHKKGQPHFKRTWACTYEVSLLASLKQFLSDSFILEEVRVRTHNSQNLVAIAIQAL